MASRCVVSIRNGGINWGLRHRTVNLRGLDLERRRQESTVRRHGIVLDRVSSYWYTTHSVDVIALARTPMTLVRREVRAFLSKSKSDREDMGKVEAKGVSARERVESVFGVIRWTDSSHEHALMV